jgi:hypothetical protein
MYKTETFEISVQFYSFTFLILTRCVYGIAYNIKFVWRIHCVDIILMKDFGKNYNNKR